MVVFLFFLRCFGFLFCLKPRSHLSKIISVSFRFVPFCAFISKSVNNQCYNPYIFPRNIWVVALIVYRFQNKRKKHRFLLLFLGLSRNRFKIDATIHTLIERTFRDLPKNVWV